MNTGWYTGNTFDLLENGNAFYPAVEAAIDQAQREVLLETFILYDDPVGRSLQKKLVAAAQRGVKVVILIDGYGSDPLTKEFIDELVGVGVRVHVFDPRPRLMGMRVHLFRRMHRKLVVIDDELSFVGGINFSEDHLVEYGDQAKQDYAVRIRGPLSQNIAAFMRATVQGKRLPIARGLGPLPTEDGAGRLVVRDNQKHRKDIERMYRTCLRGARSDVLIANAYFFPGYRLLRELAKAARRGVRVRLVLQGEPDMRIARFAATMLYDYLIDSGVEIYEYCRRPLHAKVACFDDDWVTVGSSNLDPFSLALNLEANVVVRDRKLNTALRQRVDRLMQEDCSLIPRAAMATRRLRRMWVGVVVFHILRRFPAWVGSLPAHKPKLQRVRPMPVETVQETVQE
ncbi:cardiolipin synthase ClsB [Bordetella sp. 02P26C-1]|uniref:cardiolipin synthase ClsB n=1 Tax=Bordetella sp. 02P26C-1 TaxID=2683195 RepID=UPI0013554B5B|nr:cardiolipin synthase ClsB [Bordetella sp. 02P26C-1]MVW79854.1 cardiolipin synthase ClsB [Bordetella sp. 02P26C-1]